ncbi:MAG: hypothetical protein LLG45_13125 [Actinomycetia bacterium]|nr:hypothetical protein [Actinomycetes bacterium]
MRDVLVSVIADVIVQAIIVGAAYGLGMISSITSLLINNYLIISFITIWIITFLVLRRRRAILLSYAPPQEGVTSFIPEPDALLATFEIPVCGVRWIAYIGFEMSFQKMQWEMSRSYLPHVYVHGPYCPNHDVPLVNEVRPAYLIAKRQVWVCRAGEKPEVYKRDSRLNGKEDDVVRQRAKAKFTKLTGERI